MTDAASSVCEDNAQLPKWALPYAAGEAYGYRQTVMAYAEYYCVDGSVDLEEGEFEERMPLQRPPMVGYASRTGTRRNLEALRHAGWRLLVSARGALRTEGMRYAIDNGAWTAYQQGESLNEESFMRAVDRLGEQADWIVLPDIVAGGIRSLEYSLRWLERLKDLPTLVLLAVQDGMSLDDVRKYLSPALGIFVGGTTEWKERTAVQWGLLARRRNCYLHIGRVNSMRRIKICAAAGASSFDGTSVSRYAKTIGRLDAALRQPDQLAASRLPIEMARI